MKTIGVFIGRMNPPHKGHVQIIEKSLSDDEQTLVFLGSSNILDERNPFSFGQRKYMLSSYFGDQIVIDEVEDVPNDADWVDLVGKKLSQYINKSQTEIVFYGGDLKNDYAITAIQEFENLIPFTNIRYTQIDRNILKIQHNNVYYTISSTYVRDALGNKDMELVAKMMKKEIYNILLSYI